MRHFRGINPLLGIVLAFAITGVSRGTVMASVPASQHSVASTPEGVLSLSATDYEWHADALGAASTVVGELDATGAKYLSAFKDATEQSPDSTDIIRHRGFRKILLILLVCGGLIRFLTSPTYLNFLADVLDPKAY